MVGSLVLLLAGMLADPSRCETVAKLALSNTTVMSAQWMPAGPFTPPPAQGVAAPAAARATPGASSLNLPAHCRVAIVMKPTADSHIEAEVWLPAEWNG